MYVSGHRKNDLYSLRLHRAIASKLRADPKAVLGVAMRNLRALRDRPNETYCVREWEKILSGPLDELLTVWFGPTTIRHHLSMLDRDDASHNSEVGQLLGDRRPVLRAVRLKRSTE